MGPAVRPLPAAMPPTSLTRGIVYTDRDATVILPAVPLGMDQRRNFWLLFKEMITNIVRHSACHAGGRAHGTGV